MNVAPVEASHDRRLPLQILLDPDEKLGVMKEEIFGPLLPVVSYDSPDEAIRYVNERPRPLALYWFGENRKRLEDMAARDDRSVLIITHTFLPGS